VTELPRWNDVDAMTLDQARLVRALRVDRGLTWRSIADECSGPGDDWAEGQVVGRMLCERASVLLGEDPNSHPWN
jgi:hypothetical protein